MAETYFGRTPFCELTAGAACGSGGRILDEVDFAGLVLKDGREVLWFNTNYQNAFFALGHSWEEHERILVYEPDKERRFSFARRGDVVSLFNQKELTRLNP